MASLVKIYSKQEVICVDRVKPSGSNARVHSEAQIAYLMELIEKLGYINPLIVDEDYNLLAGHGRLEAAKRLGMTQVSVLVVDGLDEVQKRSYIIADNRSSEKSDWDFDLLVGEVRDLSGEANFDINLLGFDQGDLAVLLGENPDESEPDHPNIETETQSQAENSEDLKEFKVFISADDFATLRSALNDAKRAYSYTEDSEALMHYFR